MFFYLSKTIGLLADPWTLALILLAVAALLRLLARARWTRKWLALSALIILWVFSTGVVANLLLVPLETHRPPKSLGRPPGAIVVLTGMLSQDKGPAPYNFSESADRFVEAARLAHRYPEALLIFSGGISSILPIGENPEAQLLGQLARELGIAPGRLRIDTQARNTHENAVQSKRLLKGIRGPVLLVTSASHMPRSLACFEKVGQPVIPWPVDFQTTRYARLSSWLPGPESLQRSRVAIHEYLGWIAYWIAGYI